MSCPSDDTLRSRTSCITRTSTHSHSSFTLFTLTHTDAAMTHDAQDQADELEVLKSIYGDDASSDSAAVAFHQIDSRTFQFKFGEDGVCACKRGCTVVMDQGQCIRSCYKSLGRPTTRQAPGRSCHWTRFTMHIYCRPLNNKCSND